MTLKRRSATWVVLTVVVGATVFVWQSARSCKGEQEMAHTRQPLPDKATIAKLPADGGKEFNRLIHEKSPYLLQHARNPVNWYAWGPEALAAAKKQGKPIFLSIGYSTCHWCHVMERESFERDDVAAILNANYIAIKVDREERPDIDQIYMLATQMLTGRGGWPNSLWLTADGRPWYAGTYFPREDRGGRLGFKSILTRLSDTWKTKRAAVDTQADHISKAMKQYSSSRSAGAAGGGKVSREMITSAARNMVGSFDPINGGLRGSPKFPPHGALRLLLGELGHSRDAAMLKPVTQTLDAMARGGMHDQVGGGFHRYSTDARWLVPHFEKMLYDNAQLARAYVDVYVLTGDENYRRVAEGICDWVLREMTDEAGGFHSALDADSEGHEGKFYVWRRGEIIEVLGKADGEIFCDVYNVTEEGNYRDEATGKHTGTNILHLSRPIDKADLRQRLAAMRKKLLAVRVKRVWPHKDDKVLVAWNALMIGSLTRAGVHLKTPRYTAAAERAAGFILTHMRKNGRLMRTYRRGAAGVTAYLDDYAFLADALMDLGDATGSKKWFAEAASLADVMMKHYADGEAGGFFFTPGDHEQLLTRTKDPFDSSIPAGNAVAARVLVRLAKQTGEKKYLDAAAKTLRAFEGIMHSAPHGAPSLLLAAGDYLDASKTAPPVEAKPDASAHAPPVLAEAFVSALRVAPGATIDLAVRITMDAGWHINSHKPLQKNLIATTLALAKGAPGSIGDIVYPPGKNARFAFSPEPLSVYDGSVLIRGKLSIGARAPTGPAVVTLLVNTQACDDRTCLAPQTHKLVLKLTVDSAAKPLEPRHGEMFNRRKSR